MIVDEAREVVGETVLTRSKVAPGAVEPIPESQEEINKQADLALRDLFPRIPNTDRQMIIEHAFKKASFMSIFFERLLMYSRDEISMVSQPLGYRLIFHFLDVSSSQLSLIFDTPIQDTINCLGKQAG